MAKMTETDIHELLARMGRHDQSALTALHTEFGRRIYAFALTRLNNTDDAETVVADTLYDVWKAPDRFRGESSFSTWLLGIARNKCLMTLRARDVRSESYDESTHGDLQIDDSLGQYETVEATQLSGVVERCMERLTPPHRECLRLVFFEEMSVAEVAGLQSCPEGTVKTRLFHARKNLKDCLSAWVN
jgi:RNA polymerase sigma-70 factor, ECF subfamily